MVILLFLYLSQSFAFNYFYIEQFRLFRFHWDYAARLLSHPGGAAEYAASFLIQFFIHPHVGPGVATLLFISISLGMRGICKRLAPEREWPLVYLTPGILLLMADLDFNYHLEGTLAFAWVVGVLNVYLRIHSQTVRMVFMVLAAGILYGVAGSAFFAALLCALVYEYLTGSISSWKPPVMFALGLIPALADYFTGTGGEARMYFLPDAYFNPRLPAQAILYYAWGSLPGIMLFLLLSRRFKSKATPKTGLKLKYGLFLLQVLLAGGMLHYGCRAYHLKNLYEVKKMDYYSRTSQWDALLSLPLRSGQNAMHACFQNLALAQKGILAEKFLSFNQTGTNGLWINWNRTCTVSSLLSDVYYAMGHIAQAQRMAFEGMVASEWGTNPRLLLRLVKTNLICGNHAVADKYIHLLEDTYAYRQEALALKKLAGNDSAVANDPELGDKRRCMVHTSGLSEMPADLLQIAHSNPDDPTALEYLGLFFLMDKNIPFFDRWVAPLYGPEKRSPLPKVFQEAVILAHEGDTASWSKYGVSPQTIRRFQGYRQAILSNRRGAAPADKLRASYGDTYWYYYMFKK